MNEIEKMFKKLSLKDRKLIEEVLEKIMLRNFEGLNLKKLKGYDCIFRVRVKNYRIIYFDDGEQILLKVIKKRDESTYKI